MKITLENIGKKYNRDWIFKHINFEFTPATPVAIRGGNGTGKSTLLKLISGFETPTKGNLTYTDEKIIPVENIFKKVVYTAPYISTFEEYTMKELVAFYTKFKHLKDNLTYSEFLNKIELEHADNKAIKYFSSGMKQRVKLGLSILSESSILLLDEPTSNLDKKAIKWYQNLVKNNIEDKIVIVASNNLKEESFFCTKELNVEEFKL